MLLFPLDFLLNDFNNVQWSSFSRGGIQGDTKLRFLAFDNIYLFIMVYELCVNAFGIEVDMLKESFIKW